ncbi:hypothetical protein SH580_01090 [Coraliomargarita algicola]|uniref:Uncharacterized protein n=1 Tax=Coraliomargarita algicola TaxID=3092156 RepID=A0ABZ0RJB0_9BACT|nr:hypothetical protein [Coraliomargarita sp. J2-16]WPJ96296.1 hypothetical protein SH580_01090 [Coraliomargarita sp. J2-16]
MRRILRELDARGYRRIALGISKRVDEITERRNSNTFLSEVQRQYPHITPLIADTIEETPKAAQNWILKHKPDCVISLSSLFPTTLRSYGWKVPQEIGHAYIHIEPTQSTKQATNQSGIEYNSPEIAAAAIDKLDSLLQRNELGLPERPLTLNLRGKWLEGNTLQPRLVSPLATSLI